MAKERVLYLTKKGREIDEEKKSFKTFDQNLRKHFVPKAAEQALRVKITKVGQGKSRISGKTYNH